MMRSLPLVCLFRTHGISNDPKQTQIPDQATDRVLERARELNAKDKAPWYYEMQALGFNYRITDIQCALGISQLKKLEEFIK